MTRQIVFLKLKGYVWPTQLHGLRLFKLERGMNFVPLPWKRLQFSATLAIDQ